MAIIATERPTIERQTTELHPEAAGALTEYISPAAKASVQSTDLWSKAANNIGKWAEAYADYKLHTGYWNLFRI